VVAAKSEWQNGNSNPLALLATLVPTGFSDAPSGPIEFEEIAQRAGVNFVLNASPTAQKHQPETMAGGIALLDYNGTAWSTSSWSTAPKCLRCRKTARGTITVYFEMMEI